MVEDGREGWPGKAIMGKGFLSFHVNTEWNQPERRERSRVKGWLKQAAQSPGTGVRVYEGLRPKEEWQDQGLESSRERQRELGGR